MLLFLVDLGNLGLDLLISANYLPKLFELTIYFVYLHLQSARNAKTYCSMVSQSPHEKRRAIQLKLGLSRYGRRLPISVVVCGEPRDLWRMSALLL